MGWSAFPPPGRCAHAVGTSAVIISQSSSVNLSSNHQSEKGNVSVAPLNESVLVAGVCLIPMDWAL